MNRIYQNSTSMIFTMSHGSHLEYELKNKGKVNIKRSIKEQKKVHYEEAQLYIIEHTHVKQEK